MNEQLNIFSVFRRDFRINNKIRLIELFAGVGSQAMALKRLGADFEHYKVVEFDKYAIKSYNAIHGTDFEPTDITQISGSDLKIVDTETFTYLLTYSFPCQDLSVAGKQKGMVKGSGTRSGLLWEVERLLNEVDNLPQVLLMENVPQVHSKKNMDDFQKWIAFLESKGYSNYWQDLNAKNYGVAQNRNRCFMVSILGDYNFTFPNPIELQKVMKDYLEDEVEDKYYINNEKSQKLIQKLIDNGTLPNTIAKSRAEQSRAEQSRAEQSRAEQSRHALTEQLTSQEKSKSETALRQDMTQESQTCGQTETVLLKGMVDKQLEPQAQKIDVSSTLMSRDYKGLNNYGTNGVIEWNQ